MEQIKNPRQQRWWQLGVGLLVGVCFGFLLQKGGATDYSVIIGQLLFSDMTVVKIMLAAMVTGMVGFHALHAVGAATLKPKQGSAGATVIGGVLFGVGFGLLGYCPGTVAGAAGHGALDAVAGMAGIVIGAGLFAAAYPLLDRAVLHKGEFGDLTLPRLLHVNPWVVIVPVALGVLALFAWFSSAGL
ncbi:YeeE/YedE family protein [bacterium]|nr:YeeE/YedE family protein [bacterium]